MVECHAPSRRFRPARRARAARRAIASQETIALIGEQNNQVLIDIGELTNTISTKLGTLQPISDPCCIFRSPKRLQLLNKEAYNPRFVSIGPYHHGKKEFERMEEYKKRYLQFFLQRSNTINLEELVGFVAKNEKKLRSCYGEIIEMTSQEFVEMILLDAVFIIEFLLRARDEVEDFIMNQTESIIVFDLLLVENQIPFFILEDLYEQNMPNCGDDEIKLCFRELACKFNLWMHYSVDSSMEEEIKSSQEIKHLLDFVRICSKPSVAEQRTTGKLKAFPMPTAMELQQSGLKLHVRKDRSSIFDIKFRNGVLEIPPLSINAETENMLLNILALEQSPGINDNFYNDYIYFMNLLANSPKDVGLLMQKGIFNNLTYDSERISALFRRLAEAFSLYPDSFYYSSLVEELNEYCKKRRHKWKAMLKENYLSNPWTIISVIAATVLLILTLIQTACSVIQL